MLTDIEDGVEVVVLCIVNASFLHDAQQGRVR